jgi:hypothetical protein
MLLSEYAAGLAKIIDEHAKTDLIIASGLDADYRTDKVGSIQGSVTFVDSSRLFFMEYLDVRFKVEKLTYSYHYQRRDGNLIFRYDNALHKPRLKFADHKHVPSGDTMDSNEPALDAVLAEIMTYLVSTR